MPKPVRRPPARIPQRAAPAGPPATVSGRWLLAAILLTFCAAAICAYGALCLLVYQGQWQVLFHPSHTVSATPASAGLVYDEIHFDVTDAGQPRLDGWWIPAQQGSRWAADTILYLHDARGSLSDTVPALVTLHALGIGVFAIDYQGFGRSSGRHPTERLATADSVAAWTYLTDTRHIPARSLVVYGDGVGSVFAAHIAALFAPAGVILEDPNPPGRQILLADARSGLVPLFLIQKEKLDPTANLARAHAPKLFLDRTGSTARTRQLFNASSYPKQYFDLRSATNATVTSTLQRFLDGVLQHPLSSE